MSRALFLLPTLLLAGCGTDDPTACPAVDYAAVIVRPLDSLSGALVPATIRGTIIEGAFQDTLAPVEWADAGGPATGYGAGVGRPGTYTVTVTAPGYALWSRAGVVASASSCGVVPVRLDAQLQTP